MKCHFAVSTILPEMTVIVSTPRSNLIKLLYMATIPGVKISFFFASKCNQMQLRLSINKNKRNFLLQCTLQTKIALLYCNNMKQWMSKKRVRENFHLKIHTFFWKKKRFTNSRFFLIWRMKIDPSYSWRIYRILLNLF